MTKNNVYWKSTFSVEFYDDWKWREVCRGSWSKCKKDYTSRSNCENESNNPHRIIEWAEYLENGWRVLDVHVPIYWATCDGFVKHPISALFTEKPDEFRGKHNE